MLSGCGVGFSVQERHVAKLPKITDRGTDRVTYNIEDSIEGWAESIDVLMSSFFSNGGKHPEYFGKKINFDYSLIRPKGAYISGGFKAPGPDGLRLALEKTEALILRELDKYDYLRPIAVYDIIMFIADAVISGGIRRAACIAMFSKEDKEMMNAKTGDWLVKHPERVRSNNSVILKRGEVSYDEFKEIMVSVRDYGEPGFIWVDDYESLFNPCVEVNMYAYTEDGRSGFQFCNLSEINGGMSTSKEIFLKQCKLASIIGTLQAGYTNFKFVSKETIEITERESLIGASITGWMNNPDILFDKNNLKEGAEVVKYWNDYTAKLIGINPAARCNVVKPSGNASVLLGTASGIHGEHSPRYFRHTQFNKETEIAKLFMRELPHMVEESVYSKNDIVVAFPLTSKEGSIYKKDLLGTKQLDKVIEAQLYWVDNGKRPERCSQPWLRHNVSNTITVDDWDEVTDYIFNNQDDLCGVSLLAASGDKAYTQAPFTEVLTEKEVMDKYGVHAMFASGLIEAGLTAFNGDLWLAINTANGYGEQLDDSSEFLLKRDFVRRYKKFAQRFMEVGEEYSETFKELENIEKEIFEYKQNVIGMVNDTPEALTNDQISQLTYLVARKNYLQEQLGITSSNDNIKNAMAKCEACLKDVYNLHKWINIERNMKHIEWDTVLGAKKYTDINTMAAAACSGNGCEIV